MEPIGNPTEIADGGGCDRIGSVAQGVDGALAAHRLADGMPNGRGDLQAGATRHGAVGLFHPFGHPGVGGVGDFMPDLLLAVRHEAVQLQAHPAGLRAHVVDGLEQGVDALGLAEGMLLCSGQPLLHL